MFYSDTFNFLVDFTAKLNFLQAQVKVQFQIDMKTGTEFLK